VKVFVKGGVGVEKRMVESHKPQGTPLSSPGEPLVPLVVEWNALPQFQMTESFTAMETVTGEKTSAAPGPIVTLVVSAEDVCAIATQKSAVRIAATVFRGVFTMVMRGMVLILFQNTFENHPMYNVDFVSRGKFR
jgi:hypothetical protein